MTQHMQEEKKIRLVLESAPDAMILVNKNGIIIFCNKQTKEIFGYKPEQLMNHNIDSIVPEFMNKAYKIYLKYRDHPTHQFSPINLELAGKRINNEIFPVEISLSPFRNHEKASVIAAVKDISKRKLAQIQLNKAIDNLKRSNQELEQFAYIASPDLQEPLRVISNFTGLIEKRYKDRLDKDANEFIEFIISATKRMQQLINDLLVYSRVTTRENKFEPIDPNEIVN